MQKYWLRAFKFFLVKIQSRRYCVDSEQSLATFVFELANCVSVCVFNVDIVEESKRINALQEIEIKKAFSQGKLFAKSIELYSV